MSDSRRRHAALLDRDGTLILDTHYVRDPDKVALLPGVGAGLRRLAAAGYPIIVCTNQSGIARGKISLREYGRVRRRLDELLVGEGVSLADTFTCPHGPEITPCACRKPGTALYTRAARMHALDLAACVYMGDKMRDVQPALAFGGGAALLRSPETPDQDLRDASRAGIAVVDTFADAVELLLATRL